MKELILVGGFKTFVDDEDYEYLNQWRWFHVKNKKWSTSYVLRHDRVNGIRKSTMMHRVIMCVLNAGRAVYVDHKDHNGLNNQKSNLRICSNKQNQANFIYKPRGLSKYVGVWRDRKRWRASIRINGKKTNIGSFHTEIEAAKCYNEHAIKHRGKFATLNNL